MSANRVDQANPDCSDKDTNQSNKLLKVPMQLRLSLKQKQKHESQLSLP